MSKAFFIGTLFFTILITIASAGFAIMGFYFSYPWIGVVFIIITIASLSMNILFLRNWNKAVENER